MYYRILLLLFLVLNLASCDDSSQKIKEENEWGEITIQEIYPSTILPSTTVKVIGMHFPDNSFGLLRVTIEGVFQSEGETFNINVNDLGKWINSSQLEFNITPDLYRDLCGGELRNGSLSARLKVEAISSRTGNVYVSNEIPINIQLATSLTPQLTSVTDNSVTHFESPIVFSGNNLLSGKSEGKSVMVINGCFLEVSSSGPCETNGTQIVDKELDILSIDEQSRSGGTFGVSVAALGVMPGHFEGTIKIRNIFGVDSFVESEMVSFSVDLIESEISSINTLSTSLGGYIDISGEGFAKQDANCGTTLIFNGQFIPSDASSIQLDAILVPKVLSSSNLKYVLEENVDLGGVIDLRTTSGVIDGNIAPSICCGNSCQDGASIGFHVNVGPVKQVVQMKFQDSYIGTLAEFGLQGAEQKIRERIIKIVTEIYTGINVDIRVDDVTDYALYSIVEIHGFDPNGLSLLGYDNTVGKDVGNIRLYDVIGGVNAHTQEDGFPGYGGVFLESYLGFSLHPPNGIKSVEIADAVFDHIFDPFRPDRGGTYITSEDLSNYQEISDPSVCLGTSNTRSLQVSCAVYVLGNLIGGTVAHELGHSLGLAEPGSNDIFHNLGDKNLRLMDSGGQRPFMERAGLSSEGIERFCTSNYQYLRSIMIDPETMDPYSDRPGC